MTFLNRARSAVELVDLCKKERKNEQKRTSKGFLQNQGGSLVNENKSYAFDDMENVMAMVEEFFKLPPKVQNRRIALRDMIRDGTTLVASAKALEVSIWTIENDMRWLRMMAAKYIFSPQMRAYQQIRRIDAKQK